jgi:hypothetical protein
MAATIEKRRARLTYEAPCELPEYLVEQLREKAYKLWEERGRREGNALQDWLDAERIMVETIK